MSDYYDTGKVKIGYAYIPKQNNMMSFNARMWQNALRDPPDELFPATSWDYWLIPVLLFVGVALLFINLMV